MKKENTSHIKGDHNIVIQNVTDSTITLNIDGNFKEIRNDIAELKAELQKWKIETVEMQGETFHINEIGTAHFNTSLQNTKNSPINAGGDVNIGDTTTNIIKGVSLLALVILIAIGFWQQETLKKWMGFDRVFKQNEVNFNILILPFKKICEYEGKNYDAGYVIKERLQGIIAKDSLKVRIHYLQNYAVENFNDSKAEEIRQYHHADMIVYGSYQTGDCSDEGDQFCLNYQTDKKWKLEKIGFDLNREFQSGGLDELQKGQLQEKIENIATFLSVIAQQKNIDHDRYLQKLQGLLAEKDLGNESKASIYLELADQLQEEGKLTDVLNLYEKILGIYEKNGDKYGIGLAYQRIGTIHTSLGNLEKALQYFEDYNQLKEELYESYPQNVSFKNGLAISYEKLGSTQSSLGNLEKALQYFEERSRLSKELYESNSQNAEFKYNMGISYSNLGETNSNLGNWEKALQYLEEDVKLTKELYESYPQNVIFKNGLAVSYSKLGRIYEKMEDNLKRKEYLKKAKEIWKELAAGFTKYIEFQNNL